jgi:RNA polymerase sigma factor (sigma-70 family)
MTDEFREIADHLLRRKSDEQLLAYVGLASAAARASAAEEGLWILIDRHQRWVRAKIALKIPAYRSDEIAQDVLEDAVKAVLAGKPIDNFRAWLNRVAANHIADFHRGPEGRQLRLERAAAGQDDQPGAGAEPSTPAEQDVVDTWDVVDRLIAELSESHQRIIDLYVFQEEPAKDVAEATGESADNVYQVAKRFREELRRRLEADDLGPDLDTAA